jgi:ribonuclease BN (tRNA processing enzyme)
VLKRRRPFTIIGPKGFSEFLALLKRPYRTWLDLPDGLLTVQELRTGERDSIAFDTFSIQSAPMHHTSHSIGFRIEDNRGKVVVYSGDTGYCEEIIDLARGADPLILESSFPEGEEVEGHLTPSQAGDIATRSGVNRLVLTHFYPECLKSDIEGQCRRTYKGDLILAADLMSLTVR